ncbi:DNA-directed RNA polymerase subunit omega [Anaerosporomusa subterranea]|uniref:DNA-directed RNA polymerase subunit omega n=1 Tax=Anaerosporomusa subterranea TaxID=1794912 RepID=A0A154BMA5_ANASB|nr:DNA-directed RNA polymerase subunit omega [Anaerosporomusa subterranea]KYZ75109.1 DNA-directed RNA polymerase subunit omega [Anaerosporomusa subterranea]MDF2500142.1 DNA-directed polymerase subunit omega [Anaerosporomusa subterranea]
MIYPPLDVLMEKVDCKYTLAVLSAKRAREIMSGDQPLTESRSNKPVTIALEEIAQDKIGYQRTKTGIK